MRVSSMDKVLVIDFETHDPYIDRGVGSGWVYKVNVPSSDFEVLGAAMRTHGGELYYETDHDKIIEMVRAHDVLVCHNAQYDLGCLHAIGFDCSNHRIYDTETMSRLYNSSLFTHSLDAIAKKYLGEGKANTALTDAIWKHNLYPWVKKEVYAKERAEKNGEEYVRERPEEKKLIKFSKKNMKLIQETDLEAMAKYAIGDVVPTYELYKFFLERVDNDLALKYSMCAHICIDYRKRGVRIDVDKAREVHNKLIPVIKDAYEEVYKIAGEEFNINSPKDIPRILDKLGIKYPINPKTGRPSVTKPWLAVQTHPLCQAINEARAAVKIDTDFILKIIEMQEYTSPESLLYGNKGRIYPELNLLRARTGRFSCSSPNIQQIPSRHPIYSDMCRSIFIPEEGERWYSLDFSNQEGRLQVHYANKLKCEGSYELVQGFKKDPNLDMHQLVANAAGIERSEAKVINLGLSYGMGITKLSAALGLTIPQAKVLKQKYDNIAPYLTELNDKCKAVLKKRGSIKTIAGRMSHIDPPMWDNNERRTFEYKALNKLIQGSAADQSIEAMIQAYKEDIPVLFPVHDQFCISTSDVDKVVRLKEIMEHAIELDVPSVVDVDLEGGESWTEAGH